MAIYTRWNSRRALRAHQLLAQDCSTCHTCPAGSWHFKPAGCLRCWGSFPTSWHSGAQHTPNREQPYPGKVLQVELGKKAGQTEVISGVGFGWAHHPPVCTSLSLLSPSSSPIPCLFLFNPLRPFPFPTFALSPKYPVTNLTCSQPPGRHPVIHFTQSPRALPLHPTAGPVLTQAMAAWIGFTLGP